MKLHRHCLRLMRAQQGSVFIMVAVGAMMIIASTGAAVDMARAQILQTRIQSALDAAGLAAGASSNSPPSPLPSYCGTATWVQCQAQKYFNANFPPGYLGSGPVTVTATLGGVNNSVVTLAANTTQATTFMKAVGIKQVAVAANSQITLSTSGMELVLVLDNTGSMATILPSDNVEKIQALKNSLINSGGLLDQLYGSSSTIPNFWVGIVPFADMVNIGNPPPSAPGKNWMNSTFDNALDYGPTVPTTGSTCPTYDGKSGTHAHSGSSSVCYYTPVTTETMSTTNWGGCVLARTSPYEETDTLPSASTSATEFEAYDYTLSGTSVSGSGSSTTCSGTNAWMCSKSVTGGKEYVYEVTSPTTGPNLNCIVAQVQPMVAEKSTIVNEINTMTASGNTAINLGMAWGYRMLSPNWAGWWNGEMYATGTSSFPQLPLPYHTPLMTKVIILMTDGMNNPPGTSTGTAYQGQTASTVASLDTSTETVCNNLKANGVIIYAIGFGTTDDNDPNNATAVNGPLLKYCATQNYSGDTSHYFLATTSVSLTSVFSQIGGQLSNLRVSQ